MINRIKSYVAQISLLCWPSFPIESMFRVDKQTVELFGEVVNHLAWQNMTRTDLPFTTDKYENWPAALEMSLIFQVTLTMKKRKKRKSSHF